MPDRKLGRKSWVSRHTPTGGSDTLASGYTRIPIRVLDATVGNTDILARITLHFAQTLSLARIEEAWYKLVRTWPILAARIRPTPETPSGLSFLVPSSSKLAFLEKRSRSTTTNVKTKHIVLVDAAETPVGSFQSIVGQAVHGSLSATTVSVGEAPERREQDRMCCANACMSWTELLKSDQSFVTAQATRWADATTVTVAFSHTVGDAFGVKSIFEAWAQTLRGVAPEPLKDPEKDPYVDYLPGGKKSKDEQGDEIALGQGWRMFSFVPKVKLIANLLWDIKIRRPEKRFKQYYIYMPESKVQELLAEAKRDLIQMQQRTSSSATGEKGEKEKELTVSTFNVLFAWLLQNIHASNPNRSKRSTVLTIVNAKHRPPAGSTSDDYPTHQLWGGAFGAPLNPLPSGSYASLPLGQVALHIRESLQTQVKPTNIRANIVTLLKHTLWKSPSGKLIFFAAPHDYWCGCTEWRSVKFQTIDFGGALATDLDVDVQEKPNVTPVAIGTHMEIPMTRRNRWVIFGEMGKGVWFSGGMTPKEISHKDGFGRYQFV